MAKSSDNKAESGKSAVFGALVVTNKPICADHYRLTVAVDDKLTIRPGQFVQICCNTVTQQRKCGCQHAATGLDSWLADDNKADSLPKLTDSESVRRQTLLNRPFSIASARHAKNNTTQIDVVYKVRGPGTSYLGNVKQGQCLQITGPLGKRPFELPQDLDNAILVGGGIGLPPLMFLAELIVRHGISGTVIAGAESRQMLPVTWSKHQRCKEFDLPGLQFLACTEDGSVGSKALVTDVLRTHLDIQQVDPASSMIFACGPWAMLQAVAGIAEQFGLPCQVCLEQIMGCGIGTCQSCVVQVKAPDKPETWRYALVCSEGPVFDAKQVIW